MESRKVVPNPARDEGPVQAKAGDFVPPENTVDPQSIDDPTSSPPKNPAYDCKPPRPEPSNGQGRKRP